MPYTPPTRQELADLLTGVSLQLSLGCGNHGCRINPPKGMGTNAGCQCTPQRIAKDLLQIAILIEETKTF